MQSADEPNKATLEKSWEPSPSPNGTFVRKNMNQDENNDAGYTVYESKRNRRRSRKFGTGDASLGCPFKAIQRKAHIHVWRLEPQTKDKEIKDYLEQKLNSPVIVETLNARGPYASFKITVDFPMLSQVLDLSLWPENAEIDRFTFNKNRTISKVNGPAAGVSSNQSASL